MRSFEYDLTDTQLVLQFAQACAQGGVANSGLIFDIMGDIHLEDMFRLRRALLARLAGEKPPVRPGALVRHKNPKALEYSVAGDGSRGFIVDRVLYRGHESEYAQRDEKWHITLQSVASRDPSQTFAVNDFDIIASAEPAIIQV